MRKRLRAIVFAALAALTASCGEKTQDAEEAPHRLPEIKEMHVHTELLSKPGKKITLTANEIYFRSALGNRVLLKFYESDFVEMERLAALYRGGMLTGSGIEKLGPFYWAFTEDMIVDRSGVDKRAPGIISAWIAKHPHSPTPHIARAYMFESVASRMERTGVSPAETERMQHFRDDAMSSLTRNWMIVRTDPYAHALKMRLIAGGAASGETWEEAFEAAKREHPGRFTIYFDALATTPEIGDSLMASASAAERIAVALAEEMGEDADVGYARAWWAASRREHVRLLFERGMVNWPRIRNGFYKMLERYPDAWNVNHFARFSCIVGDAETVRALTPAVRKFPMDDVWTFEDREYCILYADARVAEIPAESE